MGTMTIDGRKVQFTDEKNVLSVIRNAGIDIPTLCYHSEVSTFGACRLCTVEDDRGRTFASCSEEPRDGMVIFTNTGRIKRHRKLILELLLAAHCRDCTTCVKSGECNLQMLAHRLGVTQVRFANTREIHEVDTRNTADQVIYQTEKTLNDLGDKLTDSDKAPVQAAVEKLKETIKGTDVQAIKMATDDVQKALQAIGEKIYQAAGAAQQGAPDAGTAGQNNDGVVDADYEVVDDNQ